MWIADGLSSYAALIVAAELRKGCYALDEIDFSPGDIVIDVGAHVGLVSCYLAKRHPFLTIYAFEPFRENYENLILNLKNNGIKNVLPSNRAITSDGRSFKMKVHSGNTGGATGQTRSVDDPDHTCFEVPSTTLDRVFEENRIERCKLLKIDCEGSEHEILNTCSVLSKVEYLRGEFHINDALRERGCSVEQLIDRCSREIRPENVKVQTITMAQ
jgi:FkbM family methyltransferase